MGSRNEAKPVSQHLSNTLLMMYLSQQGAAYLDFATTSVAANVVVRLI